MIKKTIKILAVLLITAVLFMPAAFAESGGTEITRTEEGDEVIYSINLLPDSGLEGVEAAISYKDEALEYIGVQKGPLAMAVNTISISNHSAEEKTIYIAYASVNKNPRGGTIMNIRFKKLIDDPETPVIGINVKDRVNENGESINDTPVYGDASVALLTGDATINAPGDSIIALTPSGETIDPEQSGIAPGAELKDNIGEEDVKEQVKTSLWTIGAVVIVVLAVIIAIIIFIVRMVRKKKKAAASQRDDQAAKLSDQE